MNSGIVGWLRRHRAALLLGLLLIAGAVIAQAAAENSPQAGGPALSSRDAGPQGTLALALWLQRLGYRVERAEGTKSSPDDTTGLLFVLAPTHRFAPADAQLTVAWVRRGDTLVYLPSALFGATATGIQMDDGLAGALGLGLRPGPGQAGAAPSAGAVLPYFTAPPASRFLVPDGMALELRSDAWVPLIQRGAGQSADIIGAFRRLGQGRVIAVASAAFFANAHLGEADNAALVLNALGRAPAVSTVTFDEYHHGVISAPDLAAAVRTSPWGWAVLYGALATFAFALWGGRRFGPSVVVPREPGRSSADYVTAFAGLLQRHAGGRRQTIDWAQQQYTLHVRRQLAHTYGLRADLPAPELARLLAERRAIDPSELGAALDALDRPGLREHGLMAHMRALEPLLRRLLDRQG